MNDDATVETKARALVERIRECAFDGTGDSIARATWAVVYLRDIKEELERLESALGAKSK